MDWLMKGVRRHQETVEKATIDDLMLLLQRPLPWISKSINTLGRFAAYHLTLVLSLCCLSDPSP